MKETNKSLLEAIIAACTLAAIFISLFLRFSGEPWTRYQHIPLIISLVVGGAPLVLELFKKMLARSFDADLLAGISIITALLLGEYLAGTIVVLMLAGGQTLESYAEARASSALRALSQRMPTRAHRRDKEALVDVPIEEIKVGDELVVLPHEICPVDGTVVSGRSVMDESYLTGEPFQISKVPGAQVISGAINGEGALTIQAQKRAVDSRYARIVKVMEAAEQNRPKLRRLGDILGAWYTPLALGIATITWIVTGIPERFLAVLVVATPCPLLIGIPVAIVGGISIAARRGIIIRDPGALERIDSCDTMLFDKTGTLTYGKPELTDIWTAPAFAESDVLSCAASLEQFSKHPLAQAVIQKHAQASLPLYSVLAMDETPGTGLSGAVEGRKIALTSRRKLTAEQQALLPAQVSGLECVILIDGQLAALFHFRDTPRKEGKSFISHLPKRHGIKRMVLVSGDRRSEVEYLAELLEIPEVYAEQTPEQKVELVREATKKGKTIFVGDGINDAPALQLATVGIALGHANEVTTEAASVVILESSLYRIDEVLHIGARMRRIALETAIGGMALSVLGMFFSATGQLSPVQGALLQEVIDVVAILNALRTSFMPKSLTDF